jgi:hypothetical protein
MGSLRTLLGLSQERRVFMSIVQYVSSKLNIKSDCVVVAAAQGTLAALAVDKYLREASLADATLV